MNSDARSSQFVRALVVEDDPAFRSVVVSILRQLGVHRIDTVENGRQALHAIAATALPFDVVLCDLNMPTEDGVVVLRRLSACGNRSPLILMSGEDRLTLEAAGRLGAQYGLHILGTLENPFLWRNCSRSCLAWISQRRHGNPSS